MENGHDLANEISAIDAAVKQAQPPALTGRQQLWIDYNALSGLITDVTGTGIVGKDGEELNIRKMPIKEFANKIGVSRETLRSWRTMIPNFWDLVAARRQELAPQSRLQMVHEKWFLKAAQVNNWPVTEAWLINFDANYKQPRTKVEHELGNSWAKLLQHKRGAVIEGELADADQTD